MQLCERIGRAWMPMAGNMKSLICMAGIVAKRNDFKVVDMVISSNAVFMIHAPARGNVAKKCFGNKCMNGIALGFAISTEHQRWIAVGIPLGLQQTIGCSKTESARVIQRRTNGRFCDRKPFRNTCRSFAIRIRSLNQGKIMSRQLGIHRDTSNISKATDFIQPFITNNRAPDFLHGRTSHSVGMAHSERHGNRCECLRSGATLAIPRRV